MEPDDRYFPVVCFSLLFFSKKSSLGVIFCIEYDSDIILKTEGQHQTLLKFVIKTLLQICFINGGEIH